MQNRAEQNRAEQNRAEQSRTGQSRTGQNRAGQGRAEHRAYSLLQRCSLLLTLSNANQEEMVGFLCVVRCELAEE